MLFTSSNRVDIERYYVGTYVKFRETGDMLLFIKGVDAMKVYGKAENGDLFELYLDDAHPYDVDYVLPHKSFFQRLDQAYHLSRVPAKQYYRGISETNTQILSFSATGGLEHPQPISFELLKSYVNKPKFFLLEDALKTQNFTSALSPRMAYHHKTRKIYVDSLVVASVDPAKRKIHMIRPLFTNEMQELVNQSISVYSSAFEVVQKKEAQEAAVV